MKKNQGKSKTEVAHVGEGSAAPKNRSAVEVVATSETEMDNAIARKLTRPEVGSAAVIEAWSQGGHDVNALVAELTAQVEAVNSGDLSRAEGMLISQAHTLDALFVNLARRAMNTTNPSIWEAYMRMGLKAQSQCRSTLEALANLKNPPVVYAKQANFANGPQQVNNGMSQGFKTDMHAHAHTGNMETMQSKLLEEKPHGSTHLDARTTPAAARSNSTMEALEGVNRTQDARGKKGRLTERLEGRD